MKKKEKPTPKEKEFSVSPFKALKGVALGASDQQEKDAGKGGKPQGKAPAPPAKPAAPKAKAAAQKPAKSREEMEEDLLFFEAMAGVQRIDKGAPPAQVKALSEAQTEARVRRNEEDEQLFTKAIEALKMDVRFSDQLPELEELPRPAPVNRLRQVRRGSIRIDLQLDLHGLTKDEALENLARFVRAAYNRGQKGVLVITGKGNNSPGEPVLKAAVAQWLREHGKGMVSEFVQAPQEMGGGGAVVVFLKEKKGEETGDQQ